MLLPSSYPADAAVDAGKLSATRLETGSICRFHCCTICKFPVPIPTSS
jgi:hypothetical protein